MRCCWSPSAWRTSLTHWVIDFLRHRYAGPDGVKNFFARHHAAGVLDQKLQDFKGLRPQRHGACRPLQCRAVQSSVQPSNWQRRTVIAGSVTTNSWADLQGS